MTQTTAIRARVTGHVQGVSFRAWTQVAAQGLGLSGWVRNEPDGTVTALLAGPPAAVDEMLAALHEGPPAAKVTGVTTEEATETAPEGFAITG